MADTRRLKAAVLDAGTLKKREIRELQEGAGALAEEAEAAATGLVSTGNVIPVVIMYEKRSRKQRGLLGEILRKL